MSARSHLNFFDGWSDFYRATPLVSGYLRRVQKKAISSLGLPKSARVLDLGCGPGDGLRRLAGHGYRAFGGDLSGAMTRQASLLGPVARLSALALPFRDGAFDGLVCTNSFHHYPDAVIALQEMRRVLKFGGRLVLVDPSGDNVFARLVIHVGERVLFGMRDVHLHRKSEWEAMLLEAGFADASIRRAGRVDPRGRASVLLRATAG